MICSLSLCIPRSVRKPEVESLATSLLGCRKVVVTLLLGHSIPDLVALSVSPSIIEPNRNDKHDIPCHESQQHLVARAVERSVRSVVDLDKASSVLNLLDQRAKGYIGEKKPKQRNDARLTR